MNIKPYLLVIIAILLVGVSAFVLRPVSAPSFGAGAINQVQMTQGVWAISPVSSSWTALEQSGNLNAGAVNSSTTVGTTAVQLLAENFGRARAVVCAGSAGWITYNNTVTSTRAYVNAATTTITNANWFAQGVGIYVPTSTCVTL